MKQSVHSLIKITPWMNLNKSINEKQVSIDIVNLLRNTIDAEQVRGFRNLLREYTRNKIRNDL